MNPEIKHEVHDLGNVKKSKAEIWDDIQDLEKKLDNPSLRPNEIKETKEALVMLRGIYNDLEE